MGRYDTIHLDKNGKWADRDIMAKLMKRFPQLKVMPRVMNIVREEGTDAWQEGSAVYDFIKKYKKLRAKGFSEYKAFSKVEEELRQVLDTQLEETRILRGAAMAAHGDSYLDRAQRVAELESEMKLMRFLRDIPKHER